MALYISLDRSRKHRTLSSGGNAYHDLFILYDRRKVESTIRFHIHHIYQYALLPAELSHVVVDLLIVRRHYDDKCTVNILRLHASCSMAKLPLKEIIGSPKVYVASLLRLVAVPLSLYFFFKVCGVSDVVNNINTVVIAMPVASFGTMFCLKYGRNPALITELTFITTLGSILTIPLITLLFG